MTEINRYHIFVNSALRSVTSQSSSNFTINVNPPLIKTNPYHYFTAQIVSVEIPYSWTQINSTNNTLQIVYQGVYYNLTLTPGNYTVLNLIVEYQTELYKAIGTPAWKDSTSYNQNTGIINFSITGLPALSTSTYAIGINFPANPFLGRMFGCLGAGNIVYGYGSISGTYQYINCYGSTNVNVNPVSSIYIRSSNLKQIKNQENLVSGFPADPSDILCKLQVYTPPKTWVFYNGELGLSARVTNPIIDKLDIYLSDNSSFSLNLNNNDWTFRITFIEYEPIEITQAFEKTKHLNGVLNDHNITLDTKKYDDELSSPVARGRNPSDLNQEGHELPVSKTKKFQRQ